MGRLHLCFQEGHGAGERQRKAEGTAQHKCRDGRSPGLGGPGVLVLSIRSEAWGMAGLEGRGGRFLIAVTLGRAQAPRRWGGEG